MTTKSKGIIREWTNHEVALLAKEYPHCATPVLAKKFNRTLRAVRGKALSLNLKKTPEAYREIFQATGRGVGALRKRGATHNPAPTPEPWKSPSPAHGAIGAQ